MDMTLNSVGETQRVLLQSLQSHKQGLTIEELTQQLGVSRNAVRQHLATLERLGWIEKGERRASGGRPEQLYVLSEMGLELFPRQYSWFSELLLKIMHKAMGEAGTASRLAEMGRSVGEDLRRQFRPDAKPAERIAGITRKMVELGYDAKSVSDRPVIEAQNCVFHQLAMKNPDVCRFDLAMLESAAGASVEHRSCMARGEAKCRFEFRFKKERG